MRSATQAVDGIAITYKAITYEDPNGRTIRVTILGVGVKQVLTFNSAFFIWGLGADFQMLVIATVKVCLW